MPTNTDQIVADPGSTLTPVATTTPEVLSNLVKTQLFDLSNKEVIGITDDPSQEEVVNLPKKLITAFAHRKSILDIENNMTGFQQKLDTFRYNPVLSDSVVSPFFSGNNWLFEGWYVDNNRAYYTGRGTEENNHLRITQNAIDKTGEYFIFIQVNSISNCRLIVRTNQSGAVHETGDLGETILTITEAGEYRVSTNIEDPSINYFELVAISNNGNLCSVILDQCSLHSVKSIFNEYMDYTVEKLASGGSRFVSQTELEQSLNTLNLTLTNYIDSHVVAVDDLLKDHIRSGVIVSNNTVYKPNPHNVTCDQIDAVDTTLFNSSIIQLNAKYTTLDNKINTTKSEITTAYTNLVNNTKQDILNTVNASLTNHINNKNNPHAVTVEQINAAPKNHAVADNRYGASTLTKFGHVILSNRIDTVAYSDGIAASSYALYLLGQDIDNKKANKNHTHTLSDITNIQSTLDQLSIASSNITDLYGKIEEHEDIFEQLDASIIDLGENILPQINRTLTEHIQDYNNPHRVTKDQIGLGDVVNAAFATDAEAIDGELENRYLNPANMRAVLDHFGDTTERIAQSMYPKLIANVVISSRSEEAIIPISGSRIYQLRILVESNNSNLESIAYVNFDNGTSTFSNKCIYSYSNVDTSSPLLSAIDDKIGVDISLFNKHVWLLTIDAKDAVITGNIVGSYKLSPSVASYQISGMGYSSTSDTTVTRIKVCPKAPAIIQLYELATAPNLPSTSTDILPVGNVVSRFSNDYNEGYVLLDGSELTVATYQELFNYAYDNNLLYDKSVYDAELASQGYTYKFGYDQNSNTFFIPKDKASTDGTYRYMKSNSTPLDMANNNDDELGYPVVHAIVDEG